MANWKKITTDTDLTAISSSLTTTDQAISASVAALSGSASDARNLLGGASDYTSVYVTTNTTAESDKLYVFTSATTVTLTLPASPTNGDSLYVANRSGIATNIVGRNGELIMGAAQDMTLDAAQAAFKFTYAAGSQGWVITGAGGAGVDTSQSASIALLSGSFLALSESISPLSASLTATDQAISASVATLSGSSSTSRNVLVASISGSSTLPISNLSASLTTTDQIISSSVASLSGSASDARNLLAGSITTGLSGSASTARDVLASQVSGSSTAPIATLSGSLTTTDQVISSSVATLSGSASDARDLLVSQATADNIISFSSQDQGRFNFTQGGNSSLYDVIGLKPADDVTFNDIQVNGEATIEGDLTVKGTTTSINTTNLLVSDKFALFASGSTAATDGGVIIQSDVNGTGKALGFSQANSRWSLQSSLAHNATTFSSVDAFLGTVETSTAVPSATPVYGVGTIHVKTDTEDIYIYS